MPRIIKGTICISTALFFSPHSVFACGACIDQSFKIRYPFVSEFIGTIMLLFLVWIAVTVLVKIIFRKSIPHISPHCPTWRTIIGLPLLGIFGLFGLSVVFLMGAALVPISLFGAIWIVYLLTKVFKGITKRPRELIEKAFLVLHIGILIFAVFTIPSSLNRARSTDKMISLLYYHVLPATCKTLFPSLIARGQSTIDPLIEVTQKGLVRKSWISRETIVSNAVFCLARIGGPKAKAFLEMVVKERIDFKHDDWHWQKVVAFAYAECAKERAVQNLLDLYDRSKYEVKECQKGDIIAALVKTGSKKGVLFALDNLDILIKCMQTTGLRENIDRMKITATALLFQFNPEALGKIPLYRRVYTSNFTDPSMDDLRAEFYWTPSEENKLPTIEIISKTWDEKSIEIRRQWLDAFK